MELNIIGATGLVGQEIIKLLENLQLESFKNINFIASENSIGKEIKLKNLVYKVKILKNVDLNKKNITINCSSSQISNEIFKNNKNNQNIRFIDNSSALRMNKDIPLVVPHLNMCKNTENFIANPNCSTIILCCLLNPLIEFKIKRIVVSTYQAASGAGKNGLDELNLQMKELVNNESLTKEFWKKQYVGNCFVHNSELTESFYNTEEMKLINETKKILNDNNLGITATCIRVPTIRSHCESINIEFNNPVDYETIKSKILDDPNLILLDDKLNNNFPDTIVSSNNNKVFVGHIRPDNSLPKNIGWNFWISGDQLLRGAAFNAVMILKNLMS